MKHTPGPWEMEAKQKRCRKYYEHGEVITLMGRNQAYFGIATIAGPANFDKQNEMRANARLIAAAPELLAMVREMKDFISNAILITRDNEPDITQDEISAMYHKLYLLIEKAEGRG